MASARKPIASDSPSATTPRTTGRRSAQCRVIGETIGFETCAMSPSGLRTATDQFEGPRIITPSKTAWPPISELMLSVKTTWRPAPARGGAGTAPPGHPCRRASAYPCRKGGSSSRSRRAALASSSGSGTRFRTRSARSRARIRDGCRASSSGQDSSRGLGRYVASRDDNYHALCAVQRHFSCQKSRHAHRSGRLAGQLRAAVEKAEAGLDLGFADEHGFDPASLADGNAILTGKWRAETVGDRARSHGHRPAGAEPLLQRARAFGLDGDDTRLSGGGDPADEPAASGGNDDHARVRGVFFEFERNRPVPGDHVRIVESMYERATGLGDELAEALERGQRVARLEVNRAAISPRRLDLLLAHALPHDDQRVHALERGAVRERLRVVPGRDPDHAARLLLGREQGELVQDTARLERAGALEELGLEVDGQADLAPDPRPGQRLRAVHSAGDRPPSRKHLLARDHRGRVNPSLLPVHICR